MTSDPDPRRASLEAIARRIAPALNLLLEYLSEAVEKTMTDSVRDGYDSTDDKAHFNGNVRRAVRERLKPHFPTMPKRAVMSPLHLDLGPYQLKVLHAQDGELPRPQTDARRLFYAINTSGLLTFNVYPPDEMISLEEGEDQFAEGALVLIWDSEGTDLTLAALYQPTPNDAGPHIDLLALAEAEEVTDDFSGIGRRDDEERGEDAATGTEGGGIGASGAGDTESKRDDDDEDDDEA
jgi:hypothetical protein